MDDSLVACGFPRVVVCQDRGGMVGKYNLDLAYVGEGPIANDWKAARCVGKRRHRIQVLPPEPTPTPEPAPDSMRVVP